MRKNLVELIENEDLENEMEFRSSMGTPIIYG